MNHTDPITTSSYREGRVESLIQEKLLRSSTKEEAELELWEFYIREFFAVVSITRKIVPTDMVYFSLELTEQLTMLDPDDYGIIEEELDDLILVNKRITSILMSTFVIEAATRSGTFVKIFNGLGLVFDDSPELEKALAEYNNIDKTKLM